MWLNLVSGPSPFPGGHAGILWLKACNHTVGLCDGMASPHSGSFGEQKLLGAHLELTHDHKWAGEVHHE